MKKIKDDLTNYFDTAIYSSSLAMIEIVKIRKARDEELIQIAIDNNFDLNKYMK